MTFRKGQPKPAGSGRKKATPNKETAAHIMMRYGVSGIEGLCKIAAGLPLKCTTHLNKETGEIVVAEVEPTIDQRITAFKELAQYEAPKLKAIEHSGERGGDSFLAYAEEMDDDQLAELVSGLRLLHNATKPRGSAKEPDDKK